MRTSLTVLGLVIIVSCCTFFVSSGYSHALNTDVTVLDLNQRIQDKKAQVQSIKNQITIYQQSIKQREREAATLENETALLEDQIAKLSLDIQASEEEQLQLNLEIQQASLEISLKESEIAKLKEKIAVFVRQLYIDSERDYLEILIVNNSFSEFFDNVYYLEQTQADLKNSLQRITTLRDELSVQRSQLEQTHSRQQLLGEELQNQKGEIDERREAKQQLIVQSLLSKEKFQQLLNEARLEQQEISNAITDLQESVRLKLEIMGSGVVNFSWPVNPSRGISAYFHDKSYPFRSIFEHSAVDIRAYQGTYVMAAEDGYVGRAKDGGKKGYSYVMILHDKGFATVYGHLSHSMVKDDMYVKKGQVIGLSGGTPGTNGAGPFTTGPHLHFEVRVNGIPDDPLKYLP
ncbi:MAG: peptidoglycan DD-metalloendopeptidase family protein [Patescibacteria group bacterium]